MKSVVFQVCRAITVMLLSIMAAGAYSIERFDRQRPPRPASVAPVAPPVAPPIAHAVPKRAMPAVHGPAAHRPYRHAHGTSVRVWFGPPPLYYAPTPYWAYPPYVYRPVPPVVVVPAAPPPVYVERGAEPLALESPQPGFWYWCESRSAYHPAARDCPEGWVRVPPQPPAAQ